MIVLDASVLIAYFDAENAHHTSAERLQLRADTGLRLPDCCVLLTAGQTSAAMATSDRRLAGAAQRLGHPVLPLS